MNTITHPVAYFVYKRPGSTLQFLELIRDSGVNNIYIYGDGPKNENDKELIDQVKEIVKKFEVENPELSISSNFLTKNIGLKNNIIRGINDTLANSTDLIVLEDDCLPTPDFFKFTSKLLDKYKDDDKIMSVNGTSVGLVSKYGYDFSKYAHCWGWATWKRAWDLYDPSVKALTKDNWDTFSKSIWSSQTMKWYWKMMLQMTKANWIDTWDYQWSFAHFLNCGLSIYPTTNLISNIGFDSAATNTKTRSPVALLPTQAIIWPLSHPPQIIENIQLSKIIEKKFYKNPIAILGMIRQYIYWKIGKYANRS